MKNLLVRVFSLGVLLAACPACAFAKNILILGMPGGISHQMEFLTVGQRLIDRGHRVGSLIEEWDLDRSKVKLPTTDVEFIVDHPFTNPKEGLQAWEEFLKTQDESIEALRHFADFYAQGCRRKVSSAVMDKIKAFNADLIIVDQTYQCALLIAHLLDVPYISFSPTTLFEPILSANLGYLTPPSTVPTYASGLVVPRTFKERAANWAAHQAVLRLVLPVFEAHDSKLRADVGLPPLKKCAPPLLLLANAHPAVETPRQLPAGIQYVGPLLAAPSKPLTGQLAAFADEAGAKGGFIYVSFGSVFSMTDPTEATTLAAAISSIGRPVLWQISEASLPGGLTFDTLGAAPWVKFASWVPQNDVLGSPALLAFVAHGGTNSVYEAGWHGVPMINIPFLGDHSDHAARAEARGYGLTVPRATLADANPRPLAAAINTVTGDSSYKEAAQKVGALLRAHPVAPADRAAEWIQTAAAMPPGSGLPVSDPSWALPWWQRHSHDVHAAILGALSVLLGLLTLGLRAARCGVAAALARSKRKTD